jgi:hypothetical protein
MSSRLCAKPPEHHEARERLDETVEAEADQGHRIRDSAENKRDDAFKNVVADCEVFEPNGRKDMIPSCLHIDKPVVQ